MPATITTVVSPSATGSATAPLENVFGDFIITLGGKRVFAIPNAITNSENIGLGWGQIGAQAFSGYRVDDGTNRPVGHEEVATNIAAGTGSAPVGIGTFVVSSFACDDAQISWGSIDTGRLVEVLAVGEKSDVFVGFYNQNIGTGLQSITGVG